MEEDNIEITKQFLRNLRQQIEAQIKKLQEDVVALNKTEDLITEK